MKTLGAGLKSVLLPVVLALLLSSCPGDSVIKDYARPLATTVTATPIRAKVGEAVEVTVTSSFGLHEGSRVPKQTVSDITLGVCFTRGLTKEDVFIEPHGFCSNQVTPLPSSYQILDETSFYKEIGNIVVRRGEERSLSHTFTFTATEAGEVTLFPTILWTDDLTSGGVSHAGDFPQITFE